LQRLNRLFKININVIRIYKFIYINNLKKLKDINNHIYIYIYILVERSSGARTISYLQREGGRRPEMAKMKLLRPAEERLITGHAYNIYEAYMLNNI
jgi:hypothetical protein